jgi:hypothetical protein
VTPRDRDAPYFATFAAMGVTQLVLGPSIATLRHTTGTSNGTIGVLFTVSAIGYLLGIVLSGQWIAHRQVHSALRFGLLAMAAGLVLVPFAGSLGALVGIEALIGFGTGWVEIPGNSAILWKHGGGAVLNGLHASFSIGAVAAPIIIYRSLAWTNGLHAGYIVAAAVPIVCAPRSASCTSSRTWVWSSRSQDGSTPMQPCAGSIVRKASISAPRSSARLPSAGCCRCVWRDISTRSRRSRSITRSR